jgi:hypothetical protein
MSKFGVALAIGLAVPLVEACERILLDRVVARPANEHSSSSDLVDDLIAFRERASLTAGGTVVRDLLVSLLRIMPK